MTDKRNEETHSIDYYLHRARIERSKATRRFFRRLIGAVDKTDINSLG